MIQDRIVCADHNLLLDRDEDNVNEEYCRTRPEYIQHVVQLSVVTQLYLNHLDCRVRE